MEALYQHAIMYKHNVQNQEGPGRICNYTLNHAVLKGDGIGGLNRPAIGGVLATGSFMLHSVRGGGIGYCYN